MDTAPAPVIYKNDSADNFFRKKYTTTTSFAVGILLFLLPFAQLKCGSVTIAENSGIGLAAGTEWKVAMMGGSNDLFKTINSTKSNSEREKIKISPDWFILLALFFSIAGLVVSLTNWNMKHIVSMCAGILAAVMLIAAMVHLKILMNSAMSKGNKDDSLDMKMNGIVGVQFTIWYYLSLAAFIAAGFFGYRHHKIEMHDAIDRVVDFDFQEKRGEVDSR